MPNFELQYFVSRGGGRGKNVEGGGGGVRGVRGGGGAARGRTRPTHNT